MERFLERPNYWDDVLVFVLLWRELELKENKGYMTSPPELRRSGKKRRLGAPKGRAWHLADQGQHSLSNFFDELFHT